MVNGGGVDLSDPSLPFLPPIVYVERAGRLEYRPDIAFDDAGHVRRIIDKIAEQAGVRCDEAHAMGCAMLPGGRARATFVVPPLAPRRPGAQPAHVQGGPDGNGRPGARRSAHARHVRLPPLGRCGALPHRYLGGTGSGKTTLLNALSEFIPAGERVITLEDTPELRLRTPHTERMQTREANVEGEGAVGMRELVAIALRRRPDRIIVGECRGAEAYDMLQAMQTDHPGSMTTVHANDPGNAISRLRTMVGYADGDLNREVIMQQIAESLSGGLIVHVERLQDGNRRVTSIVAVDPLPEGGAVIPRAELFAYDVAGVDDHGWVVGAWRGMRHPAPAYQGAHGGRGRLVRPRMVLRGVAAPVCRRPARQAGRGCRIALPLWAAGGRQGCFGRGRKRWSTWLHRPPSWRYAPSWRRG
ncbi:MAG: ATPase, T2SS/T4P/T4SS family [Gordonibacter pamelaeae]